MTTDLNQIAEDLNANDFVATAKVWKDRRVYVNLANTDRSFRGDQNASIYFEGGKWHVDHGKGTNSPGYNSSFNAFHAAYIAEDVK